MAYDNKLVKNRKSPSNEQDYINAYRELNPKACRRDNLDIACVTSKSGERGHALVNQSINRSKDNGYHRGTDFISDKDLKKKM